MRHKFLGTLLFAFSVVPAAEAQASITVDISQVNYLKKNETPGQQSLSQFTVIGKNFDSPDNSDPNNPIPGSCYDITVTDQWGQVVAVETPAPKQISSPITILSGGGYTLGNSSTVNGYTIGPDATFQLLYATAAAGVTVAIQIIFPGTKESWSDTLDISGTDCSGRGLSAITGSVILQGQTAGFVGLEDDLLVEGPATFSPVTGAATSSVVSGGFHQVKYTARQFPVGGDMTWNWSVTLFTTSGAPYSLPNLTVTQPFPQNQPGVMYINSSFALPNLTWLRDANNNIVAWVTASADDISSPPFSRISDTLVIGISGPYSSNLCNTGLSDPAPNLVFGDFIQLSPGAFRLPVPPSTAFGTIDPHWQLATPFPSAHSGPLIDPSTLIFGPVFANVADPSWLPNGPASEWITPEATLDPMAATPLPNPELGGQYVYRTTFNGAFPLTGQFSSDNELLGVFLNDTLVSSPLNGPTGYATFTPFNFGNSSLGLNTLAFVVRNRGGSGFDANPTVTGLRVEFDQNQCSLLTFQIWPFFFSN